MTILQKSRFISCWKKYNNIWNNKNKKAGDFLKFIHIADVHWGAKPEKNRSFGMIRENEIKETFQKVIEYANQHQTDVLLIAGDFFRCV